MYMILYIERERFLFPILSGSKTSSQQLQLEPSAEVKEVTKEVTTLKTGRGVSTVSSCRILRIVKIEFPTQLPPPPLRFPFAKPFPPVSPGLFCFWSCIILCLPRCLAMYIYMYVFIECHVYIYEYPLMFCSL